MVNIAISSLAGRGRLRAFLLTEVSPDAVRFLLTLGLLPLKGLVALVAWEFFRVWGQTRFCFSRVTRKQPGLYMSAPGQTSDCELMSCACRPSTKPSSAAPHSSPPPCQYFSTTSCLYQEVKHIWVRPTTRSQLTQEFVHIWILCFT